MEQNEIDPYRFSKEVIEYFNMVRSNPKKFASIIREYKQYFKGKVLRVPNSKVGIMTKEGADAFEEAAKYLDSVKAINTVKYNVGLTHVAKEVVDAAAKTDDINSLDELDMDAIFEKYGKFVGAFSRAMDFGSKDSKMVIINLIVCDGDSSRGQREGIFNSELKEHIEYLQEKYNIVINTVKPKIPITLAVKKYGQPFLSKMVSENIQRLQRHGFKWEDKPFNELIKEYPNCKSALQWWCNAKENNSLLGINRNKNLKNYMINNKPNFSISNKCCKYAKKDILKDLLKNGYDLHITGIRKSEGGVRAVAYKSCFDTKESYDDFRPIFWFTDNDKVEYRKQFNVSNSKCYSVYGLERTGCVGCPFGKERRMYAD